MAGAAMITPTSRSAGRLCLLTRDIPEEVRTVPLGLLPSRSPTPALDRGVVPGEENLGNRHAANDLRPRVMRMIEETVLERVVPERFLTSDHAGNEPRDGLQDNERGNLSTRKDVVADRELLRREALDDALVDPLVAA